MNRNLATRKRLATTCIPLSVRKIRFGDGECVHSEANGKVVSSRCRDSSVP